MVDRHKIKIRGTSGIAPQRRIIMERNSIKNLLMSSNYYALNKTLVKNLGIETAFFLTTLVEADETLADDDGWFYQTSKTLEEITGLSNHKQTKCIEQLISLDILVQENKGIPMKRYFKLNYDKILISLNTRIEKNSNQEFKKVKSQSLKNLKTSFQKTSNNKEYNINNLDKEYSNKQSSSSVDESTQPQQLDEKSIEFRNDIIELKDIIIQATGENQQTVDMVFKPVLYREIIKPLLAKIKASKFLMGEKSTKPKLYTFIRQDRVNEILAGMYDDFKTEKTKHKGAEVVTVEDLKEKAKRDKEQEEFEKMMTSYIGTSIEDKPAWLKRGERLHRDMHKKLINNYIPTVHEAIKFIDCWLEYHYSRPCPNDRSMTIKECLNTVQKQDIDKNILNDLMMKTEARTINKHGITFLGMHYRSDYLLDLREKVFIRYSLFDLSKVSVYSMKGEFLCIARQVEKVHPMANHLGTVKDMEQFKQQIQKQQRKFKRVKKEFLKYFPKEKAEAIEIEQEEVIEIEKFEQTKTPLKRKLNFREQQMNIPVFNADYEKYEWLMKYGCTNPEQRKWLEGYLNSDEYANLYADCENNEKNVFDQEGV